MPLARTLKERQIWKFQLEGAHILFNLLLFLRWRFNIDFPATNKGLESRTAERGLREGFYQILVLRHAVVNQVFYVFLKSY